MTPRRLERRRGRSAQNCAPELNQRSNICERFNRVTSGLYEPGSTFKLYTAAMALEYGTVQPWGGYDASRPIRIGRFTINDFRGRGRWLALPEILVHSSNLAAAHMAAAVGPTRHREFMAALVRPGREAQAPAGRSSLSNTEISPGASAPLSRRVDAD